MKSHKRPSVLTLLAVTVLVAAWAVLFRPGSLGGPATYIVVSGTSMEPLMHTGDFVILQERPQYEVGDVVAYPVRDGTGAGALVIHRIIGGSADAGFVLQGDNRDEPDEWHPTGDEIVGKQWVHVPGAGSWLLWAARPANLFAVFASVGMFTLLNPSQRARRLRRRRPGDAEDGATEEVIMLSSLGRDREGAVAYVARGLASEVLAPAFYTAAGLAVIASAFAVLFFTRPASTVAEIEVTRYTQQASVDYRFTMLPSTLYPDRTVTPAGEPTASVPEQAIFADLALALTVDVEYALEAPAALEGVQGTIGAAYEIRADNGWSWREDGAAPRAFTSTEASTGVNIDIAEARTLIATLEEETGYRAGTYEIAVLPEVRLSGTLGGEAIEETYAPPITFTLDGTRIVPPTELLASEPRTATEREVRPASVAIPGLPTMDVATGRIISLVIAVPSLLAAGALAAVLYLGVGQRESDRIRARYGSLLLPVSNHAETLESRRHSHVGRFEDLVRLAKREPQPIIFNDVSHPSGDRFYVDDGMTVYEYVVIDRAALRESMLGR